MPRKKKQKETEAPEQAAANDAGFDLLMMEKSKIIGKNIRKQRRLRKFSMDVLAECLDLSASYVGLLERGDRCPSLKILYKLCDLFSIEPNDLLLADKTDSGSSLKISEGRKSDPRAAVLTLLQGLNKTELEYVKTVLIGLNKLTKKSETNKTSEGDDSEVVYFN